jgi:NAD/NADP transhydrogenase alpha subunit
MVWCSWGDPRRRPGTPLFTQIFGFLAVVLGSLNVFGGFVVTDRGL